MIWRISSTNTSSIQSAPSCSRSTLPGRTPCKAPNGSRWPTRERHLMSFASNAAPTDNTAANFAWLCSPGSTKASFATKSATVSPTPPRADIAKRSTVVTPPGRPKPRAAAKRLAKPIPNVLPMIRAASTETVRLPAVVKETPAFAKPKKNIPMSTGNFTVFSNMCRGAWSECCMARSSAAFQTALTLRALKLPEVMDVTLVTWNMSSTSAGLKSHAPKLATLLLRTRWA
mmetsp:Transcript_94757/g.305899  ORF Transcript_94757/g.305899 Transcript_94757/m.305899 type:complete len:230 (-) Transcript_94757:1519-2208(-)